jgi:hypothetical protein
MAGMELDDSRAHVEGRQVLADAAELRWGKSKDRDFCATVVDRGWNWQFCAPDLADRRKFVLDLAKSYALTTPGDALIQCENNGC